MKAWIGLLGIFGLGCGVGWFAGERYGRKKAAEERFEATEVSNYPTEVSKTPEEEAENIAKEAGYIPDEDDMEVSAREMDDYLAETQHPSDDEPKDDSRLIEVLFDQDIWDRETDYDCVELFFYAEDEIVCDEDDHRIEDVEDLIGPNTLNDMKELGVQVIFAKNHWNETLYKITRIENAYGRVVLGLDDNYVIYHDEDDL